MSLQTQILSEEEKEAYNRFVANHPKGHVLQSWQWGEVKAVTGWRPWRLAVRRDGVMVAAVSILERTLPASLGCLFYSPRGPVVDMADAEAWLALQKAVRDLAIKEKAICWKCDPDVKEDNQLWAEALKQAGFHLVSGGEGFEGVQPRHVFRLDIRPDLADLLAACHQKTRYNIRLAEKKGVKIISGAGREELRPFFNILTVTSARDKFLIRPLAYFTAMYDHLEPAGQARLFMAYYEDEPVAGTLALRMGDKAWYLYGASANSHRNLMPNYLLQWKMIEWAKAEGCTLYDFRGVPGDVPEDHPLYGLVKFKRGFAGEYTSFIGEYDCVYNKLCYHVYGGLLPVYQKAVRKVIRIKKKLRGR